MEGRAAASGLDRRFAVADCGHVQGKRPATKLPMLTNLLLLICVK